MPGVFLNPVYTKGGFPKSIQDHIKSPNNKLEMIEEGEDYFIYYKPYSRTVEKLTKRGGNVFVCINRGRPPLGWHADGKEYWVEYSDKEWPKMKTIPPSIKERALAFRTFYTLKEKITTRT